MKLNETHVYACSPEQLLPYFTDPERVVAKYQGLKADKVRVMDHEVDGDSVTIATSRDMKNNAPAMLRSVLGDSNRLQQYEQWQLQENHYQCRIKVELVGIPVSIEGTLLITPTAEGCQNQITLDISCGIPFIGGKVTDYIVRDCRALMQSEYRYLQQQISADITTA
ncbi:DUF2505 family protein [Plesiomonas shigelloides]|uniref:DUF2505 domain-containing protein n=1 Tax=Plesiomonas shigelloides TaxID=703 RepID=UPI001261935D|nr:DUF2505 domain-containing protein [Plesiomonas shigelloides]KAB7688163.1 DUF2505 family protein [Plesiomonas shigelloides]